MQFRALRPGSTRKLGPSLRPFPPELLRVPLQEGGRSPAGAIRGRKGRIAVEVPQTRRYDAPAHTQETYRLIIRTTAYARAALVGNPSDGYFGKTIAFTLRNFSARVTLYESPEIEILPLGDTSRFGSMEDLVRDVSLHGYYGGLRLIKAAVKRFADYCRQAGVSLPPRQFTIRYESDVPRQVGLAGSSAIVTATLRALMRFYDVTIPKHLQPGWILSVEREELGIPAGLQDRVIQVYEGLVAMDFSRAIMEAQGFGVYESLSPALLPPLYVAYDPQGAEESSRPHAAVRVLFEEGRRDVVDAMRRLADLTDRAKDCLLEHRTSDIPALLDENFDIRATIFPIAPRHRRMIDTARAAGACAKYAGSGGAIVGVYRDEAQFGELSAALEGIGCVVLRPRIEEEG